MWDNDSLNQCKDRGGGEGGLSSSLTSNSSNITKNITDINIGKDFSVQKNNHF